MKNEWKKVTEKHPEKEGSYLFLIQRRPVIGTYYNGRFYKGRPPAYKYKEWLNYSREYRSVSHWIELPELPPKGK